MQKKCNCTPFEADFMSEIKTDNLQYARQLISQDDKFEKLASELYIELLDAYGDFRIARKLSEELAYIFVFLWDDE